MKTFQKVALCLITPWFLSSCTTTNLGASIPKTKEVSVVPTAMDFATKNKLKSVEKPKNWHADGLLFKPPFSYGETIQLRLKIVGVEGTQHQSTPDLSLFSLVLAKLRSVLQC